MLHLRVDRRSQAAVWSRLAKIATTPHLRRMAEENLERSRYGMARGRRLALHVLLTVPLVGLPHVTAGQTLRPSAPVVEVFRDRPPLSGVRIAGVMFGGTRKLLRLRDLAVWIPETPWTTLCLDIRSRDGRYVGNGAFRASACRGGLAPVPESSSHRCNTPHARRRKPPTSGS